MTSLFLSQGLFLNAVMQTKQESFSNKIGDRMQMCDSAV